MKISGIQYNYAWIIAFVILLLQESFAAKFETDILIKRLIVRNWLPYSNKV